MSNTIKISKVNGSNYITNFETFGISISNNALGYSKIISKTFVKGAPTTIDQVLFNPTDNYITFYNLYLNLVANNADANTSFSFIGAFEPEITITFSPVANYNYYVSSTANGKISVQSIVVPDVVVNVLPALSIDSFAIEIIDTYVNSTLLAEEFTAAASPKLEWNGGDDLYATFMTSKLTFNMIVKDAADAKFIHLFTGDEQRYKLKISSVDVNDVFTLIWQGFLLPDQYKEPWTGNVFFVEFMAVDMVASLKGKYLKPWFYPNRFPIAELIAEILKLTGLEQNLLVSPSVIPSDPLLNWENIIVPLEQYFDGKKYTDVYQILEDILKANCLTLYSYRGYWWLEGFS
ncbi:MAG: hypothetical protein H7221_07025, partial [Flavobacterium sp.]|nr:hypothetical protein [Flavobacterium sp.]